MLLIPFLQVKLYRKDNAQLTLTNQPWARCERLQELVSESQRNLRKFFPQVQRSMQLYLAHRETEFILFRPIRVILRHLSFLIQAFFGFIIAKLFVLSSATNVLTINWACPHLVD